MLPFRFKVFFKTTAKNFDSFSSSTWIWYSFIFIRLAFRTIVLRLVFTFLLIAKFLIEAFCVKISTYCGLTTGQTHGLIYLLCFHLHIQPTITDLNLYITLNYCKSTYYSWFSSRIVGNNIASFNWICIGSYHLLTDINVRAINKLSKLELRNLNLKIRNLINQCSHKCALVLDIKGDINKLCFLYGLRN